MRKRSGQVHSRESSATLQLTVSLLYRCVKTVDSGTGTWYYNGIVSLFIEGERYEQEKTSL